MSDFDKSKCRFALPGDLSASLEATLCEGVALSQSKEKIVVMSFVLKISATVANVWLFLNRTSLYVRLRTFRHAFLFCTFIKHLRVAAVMWKFFIRDGSGSCSTWSPFLYLDTNTYIVVSKHFGMTTDLIVLGNRHEFSTIVTSLL